MVATWEDLAILMYIETSKQSQNFTNSKEEKALTCQILVFKDFWLSEINCGL